MRGRLIFFSCTCLMPILATMPAHAQDEILHVFTGAPDGQYPAGGLTPGPGGVLYGNTASGGGSNLGIIFQLTPPAAGQTTWTEQVLYDFPDVPDAGLEPSGTMLRQQGGALIGTTESGLGEANYGTVFRLLPPAPGGAWTIQTLHYFTGADGDVPQELTAGAGNTVFGVTLGGIGNNGTVFELAAPAPGGRPVFSVLHQFPTGSSDGTYPTGRLAIDGAGNLYGVTNSGLTGSTHGIVFELSPPASAGAGWTETVLHTFTNGADGGYPQAGVTLGPDGALYGTTGSGGEASELCTRGCGTVYRLAPSMGASGSWTLSTIYAFHHYDGYSPAASVSFNASGTLYGTTICGGTGGTRKSDCGENGGNGVIFKLTPPPSGLGTWTEAYTAPRGPFAGMNPMSDVLLLGSYVYTTASSGGGSDLGTVIRVHN